MRRYRWHCQRHAAELYDYSLTPPSRVGFVEQWVDLENPHTYWKGSVDTDAQDFDHRREAKKWVMEQVTGDD